MIGCCGVDTKDWCKVEETDKGLTITVTSDDPKKVEALKTLRKSYLWQAKGKTRPNKGLQR
jgi:hypothetical protein